MTDLLRGWWTSSSASGVRMGPKQEENGGRALQAVRSQGSPPTFCQPGHWLLPFTPTVNWRFIFLRRWHRGSCNRGGQGGRQGHNNKHLTENRGMKRTFAAILAFSLPTSGSPTIPTDAPSNLSNSLLVSHSSLWADATEKLRKSHKKTT